MFHVNLIACDRFVAINRSLVYKNPAPRKFVPWQTILAYAVSAVVAAASDIVHAPTDEDVVAGWCAVDLPL